MNKKILSGSTLKIIAIVTMLIDHIGSVVLINGIAMNASYGALSDKQFDWLMTAADYCHIIGRLAFPLFCFLLVEGFYHTKNLKKYLSRLSLMALLTEPIYDLAINGSWINFSSQNVLVTLLLGLLTLLIIKQSQNNLLVAMIACTISGFLAYYLRLDGWYYGIILITLFYFFREKPWLKYLSISLAIYLCGLDYSLQALLDPYLWFSWGALLLIALYNGQRGLKLKVAFYLFYPIHLLLLYVLSQYVLTLL